MANESIKYLLQGVIVVAMVMYIIPQITGGSPMGFNDALVLGALCVVGLIIVDAVMPTSEGYTPRPPCKELRDIYLNLIKILLQVQDKDINKSIPSVSLLLKDPMLSDIPKIDEKIYQDALNKLNQEYLDNNPPGKIVGKAAIDKFENEHPFKSINTLIIAIINDYYKECDKLN